MILSRESWGSLRGEEKRHRRWHKIAQKSFYDSRDGKRQRSERMKSGTVSRGMLLPREGADGAEGGEGVDVNVWKNMR